MAIYIEYYLQNKARKELKKPPTAIESKAGKMSIAVESKAIPLYKVKCKIIHGKGE